MNRIADHNFSPFGGFRDPILLAHNARLIASGNAMVANASSMRTVFGRDSNYMEPDERTNVSTECGWPSHPTAELFGWLYLTDAIAARVVEFMARQAWQVKPTVKEGEDDEGTPFLDSWWELNRSLRGGEDNGYFPRKSHALFRDLETFDIVMGIGDYGALYYALDDGVDPSKPVAGFIEQGSKPGGKDEVAKAKSAPANGNGVATNRYRLTRNAELTKGRKLLQVQALPETLAKVVTWETNPTSPRNGLPVMYQITRIDPERNWSGSMPPTSSEYVHWTRIVHGVDTSSHASGSKCLGNSRLRSVLPEVLDGRKISGADGVAFWRNACMKIFLESNPSLGGDVLFNRSQTSDDFENMMNGFQQWMFLRGLHANPVAPTLVDPSPHQKAKIERICIKYGWPTRIFVGSERGELASSQDEVQHRDNVRQHEEGHVSEEVIAPAINRLVAVGVLERWGNEEGYNFEWPDIGAQDPEKKARVFASNMQALAAASQQNFLSDKDVLVEMGKTEEEAEAILEEAEAQIIADEEAKMEQAEELGMKVEAPEGIVDPEQQEMEQEVALEKAKSGGGGPPQFGGKKPPFGGKKPTFVKNQEWWDAMEQARNHGSPDDPDYPHGDGGASGLEGKTPVERIANAIKLVSTYGRDASRDRELADAIVEEVSDQPKAELFETLKASGVEGARPTDTKVSMMRRLHTRLTAAIRAKERAEV